MILSGSPWASAQSSDEVDPEPVQGLAADAWIGAGASSVVQGADDTFALAMGTSGLYHSGWFEVGGGLTAQGLFGAATAHTILGTGLAGVRILPYPNVRIEILSEGGVDEIQIDPGLFESGSGGSASLPYAGARLGMTLLGRGRWRFVWGWWATAGGTIGSARVTSEFTSCFLWCDGVTQTNTVGGFGWTLAGRLGIESKEW